MMTKATFGLIQFKPTEEAIKRWHKQVNTLQPPGLDAGFWLIENPHNRDKAFRAQIPGCPCWQETRRGCTGWHRKRIEKIAKAADKHYEELPAITSDFALFPWPEYLQLDVEWVIMKDVRGLVWRGTTDLVALEDWKHVHAR